MTDLDHRLAALDRALTLADGRLEPAAVAEGRAVAAKAGARLGLGVEATVAAIAGATGSGKSSLFNALAGVELSPPGVRRPTTGEAHACTWGGAPGPLLDWLGARRRYTHEALLDQDAHDLDGLVLLDLPDHDSTVVAHRLEVDRLVAVADLLVWVLDPQKYADAAVHDRYLRPLASHAGVTMVVLNQVDRIDPPARDACLADLRRLLVADGLTEVPLLATSTRTGEGLDDLRSALARRVAARRTAVERLSADVASTAARLSTGCGAGAGGRRDADAVVDALADAAGVNLVADTVAAAHRYRGGKATGWPFTRWIRRFRPDPLRRFHLGGAQRGEGGSEPARTSLPPTSAVGQARSASALRQAADAATGDLDGPWPGLVRRAATAAEGELPDLLDRAVASTDLGVDRGPRWWAPVGVLQLVLAAVVAVGVLWLVALFAVAWLQLPDPPLPRLGEVPWPTVLLLGGAVAGLVLAAVVARLNAVGARRRARTARRRLRAAVATTVEASVLAPIRLELEAHDELCAALAEAGSSSPRRRR